MSLKIKFALLFTVVVSSLMAVSFLTVYFLYADFRQDEFYQRLRDKCTTTYRLLIEVEEIDHDLLQVIDRNTINALYDEKVLIFNDKNEIIYSSIDDKVITYSKELLDRVRKEGEVIREEKDNEVYGLLIKESGGTYVILASAYDKYGWRKLKNLKQILIITFVVGLLLIGFLSFVYVRGFLKPLEVFSKRVSAISEKNLNERIEVIDQQDEFALLARNFNQMLDRIDNAFDMQKTFVHHASHELRTPLASMIVQTEKALTKELTSSEYKLMLRSLLDDQHDLAQLINSLLLLSKYEQVQFKSEWKLVRLDEVLYSSIELVQALHPGTQLLVEFATIPEDEMVLSIKGNEVLLESAFRNLIKNACQYASEGPVKITLDFNLKDLNVIIENKGTVLQPSEAQQVFTPFFRGSNSATQKGYGLGLSICQRIITVHQGSIHYHSRGEVNVFTIAFPKTISF